MSSSGAAWFGEVSRMQETMRKTMASIGSFNHLPSIAETVSRNYAVSLTGLTPMIKTAAFLDAPVYASHLKNLSTLANLVVPPITVSTAGYSAIANAVAAAVKFEPWYVKLNDTFASYVRGLAPFNPDYLRNLIQPLAGWQDFLAGLPLRDRRLAAALMRAGWWLMPTWTVDFIGRLELALQLDLPPAKRRRSSGERVVARLLLEHYSAPGALTALAATWDQPEFRVRGRRTTISRAFRDFRAKKYYAVTMPLALMVEGVMKDFAVAEGKLATDGEINHAKPVELYKTHLRSEDVITGSAFDDQIDLLFEGFGWTKPVASGVLRHTFAHGFQAPGNSWRDALRMILMLETLHELITHQRPASTRAA